MSKVNIETKSGWIISDLDNEQIKEIQYFELDLLPDISSLMLPKVGYFTTDKGLTWTKCQSVFAASVYDSKEKAKAFMKARIENRKQLGVRNIHTLN